MDFTALALIALLVCLLIGGAVWLLSKTGSKNNPEPDVVPDENVHTADTNILTQEEAASMRLKAEADAQATTDSEELAARQNADTNVFTPEEMEAIREKAKKES
ncbi:MAG TPA: hypothetical protein DCM54_08475 [Gammaproteobacteria bacterium]|nr:hypothetical protein [Gammaproteobacteria bacterium]